MKSYNWLFKFYLKCYITLFNGYTLHVVRVRDVFVILLFTPSMLRTDLFVRKNKWIVTITEQFLVNISVLNIT